MVEIDKENSDRSIAGTSSATNVTSRQLQLFVRQIFFGPIELNPCSTVSFKWDDNPNVSGKLSFQVLHEKTMTDMHITFEMFEGCFGFVSNEQHRHALIVKFRDPCQKKAYKKFLTPKILHQLEQYQLTDASHSLMFLTIILNEAIANGLHNAIAEDEKKISINATQLRSYMIDNIQAKFREDGRERYFKIRKRHPHIDYCFYDVINNDNYTKFLKKVGIKIMRHKNNTITYEGTMPMNNISFELHNSAPSNSSESHSKEASNELMPGRKTKKKDDYGLQHGQQSQLLQPLSSLVIQQKEEQQMQQAHGLLGKRPRSRLEEREKTPPPVIERDEEGDGEEAEDEDEDDEDEEMEYDDEEGEEDEEESQESSSSRVQKKSSTPEIVDLESDEEEIPSPSKKPKPRDVLMVYKSTTLHFEDMKGLFFDEMVNDTIVDLYLAMMKDESVKPHMQVYRDRTHVFSCFFHKRLTEGMAQGPNYKNGDRGAYIRFNSVSTNYQILSKWTRKVDLFKMDYVVIPVVDDLHWYLVIMVKPYKCIVPANGGVTDNLVARRRGFSTRGEPATYAVILDSLYDSNCHKRQTTIDIIRDYLELEYKHKKGALNDGMVFDRTRMDVLRPKHLPQQSNFLDCGFYLLKYAETFMTKPPEDTMLHKGVLWRDWYVGFEIGVKYMRELVARTIQKKTDTAVWRDYKVFENSRRKEWAPDRKQRERIHVAKRRRFPSEEPHQKKDRRVRRHSEPPSLHTPMAGHFH